MQQEVGKRIATLDGTVRNEFETEILFERAITVLTPVSKGSRRVSRCHFEKSSSLIEPSRRVIWRDYFHCSVVVGWQRSLKRNCGEASFALGVEVFQDPFALAFAHTDRCEDA